MKEGCHSGPNKGTEVGNGGMVGKGEMRDGGEELDTGNSKGTSIYMYN